MPKKNEGSYRRESRKQTIFKVLEPFLWLIAAIILLAVILLLVNNFGFVSPSPSYNDFHL